MRTIHCHPIKFRENVAQPPPAVFFQRDTGEGACATTFHEIHKLTLLEMGALPSGKDLKLKIMGRL